MQDKWRNHKLKNIGFTYSGLKAKTAQDFLLEENFNAFYIPYKSICKGLEVNTEVLEPVHIHEREHQFKVEKNDLLFLMSSETYEDIGKSAILTHPLNNIYLNSFCKGFRITDESIHPKFINYCLNSKKYRDYFKKEAKGFTRINIKKSSILQINVSIPPLPIQNNIVNQLDEKLSTVQKFISKKKKTILQLKTQRQKVIDKAINKGLSSSPILQETGLTVLSSIPKNWTTKKIKNIAQIINGYAFASTDLGFTGIPVIRIGDIGNVINLKEAKRVSNIVAKTVEHFTIKKGDILCAMTGATIGKTAYFDSKEKALLNQRVCSFRSKNIVPEYLYYFTVSSLFKDSVNMACFGSAQKNISKTILGNFQMPYPPNNEQLEIVNYLKNYLKNIDQLIENYQQEIILMEEYWEAFLSNKVLHNQYN